MGLGGSGGTPIRYTPEWVSKLWWGKYLTTHAKVYFFISQFGRFQMCINTKA